VLIATGSRTDTRDLGDDSSRPHADGIFGWPRRLFGRLLRQSRSARHDAENTAMGVAARHAARDGAAAQRERDAVTAAQLAGVHLAGRTIAHLVNNDLTVTVGALDLLRAQGNLPPHLHALLDEAIGGIYAATDHVEQVRRISHVVTIASPAGPSLDLDRCTDVA
jgi:hypothetical protein